VLYAGFALLWIIGSDAAVSSLPFTALPHVQTLKGFAFVAVTAAMLYTLLYRSDRERRRAYDLLRTSEREYRFLFQANPSPMWVFDVDTLGVLAVNDAALSHYGYSREEFLKLTMKDVVAADQSSEFLRWLSGAVTWPTQSPLWHHRRKDGALIDVEVRNHGIFFQGRRARLVLANDVTEQRKAQKQLLLAATAFDTTRDSIVVSDSSGRIIAANRAFAQCTGYSESEILGQPITLTRSEQHDEACYAEVSKALAGAGYWEGQLWRRRKDGTEFLERLSVSRVDDPAGGASYVTVGRDMSDFKRAEDQIHHLAHYDSVTHLPNRNLLADRGRAATAFCKRSGKQMGVFYVDVDHFKHVNESLGHAIGDRLLEALAARLKRVVRGGDTVARWSADEFVLIVLDTDRDAAASMARRIQEAISTPFNLDGEMLSVGATAGIALFPDDGEELDVLIQNADTAARLCKESGRGRFRFFEASMSVNASERLALESALREALGRNELDLHYQPQLELATGRLVGVEALLRWRHPTLGNVSPAKFIPIAEASGLIVEIGAWVMDKACRQNRVWIDAGLLDGTVAVNLSAHQIRGGTIVEDVRKVLSDTGLPPHYLELELTESLLLDDAESTLAQFQTLKDMGVRLSIDDFGTGYSNLAYLNRFPAHKLKVDQSFVRNLAEREGDRTIVQTIVSLGHGLRLTVIAEGVETQAHAQLLRELGCDEAQGYLFARPMPAADLERWVVARREAGVSAAA
jgi:diguanylate cyclase (GGDEF)-like protein/PAS domain S-box-containing protein